MLLCYRDSKINRFSAMINEFSVMINGNSITESITKSFSILLFCSVFVMLRQSVKFSTRLILLWRPFLLWFLLWILLS